MTGLEQVFFWASVFGYAISTLLYAYRFVKGKTGRSWSVYLLLFGLLANLAAIALRAYRGGHMLSGFDYEDGLITAALTASIYLYWQKKMPGTWPAALICLPFAFLMMGYGYLVFEPVKALKPSLISRWMIVHAAFALLAVGSLAYAAAVSIIYLLKDRYTEDTMPRRWVSMPDIDVLKDLSFRLVLIGFIGWTVMIVTGAFWAKDTYDNYWSWDPIEVWSLISWLLWGIYIHISFTYKLKGKLLAWLCIGSFVASVVTMWGVELIAPKTYHNIQQILSSF